MRKRIIGLAVGTALLVIVLAAVPIVVLLHNHAYAEADQRATAAAQSAADYLSSAPRHDPLLAPYVQRLNGRDDPPVTVLFPDGGSIGPALPDDVVAKIGAVKGPPLVGDHDQDTLHEVSPAYTTGVPGGRAVQVFTRTPEGVARAVAVIDDSKVRATIWTQYGVAAAIALGLLLLAWVAAELTGRRMVRPLQRTALTAIALRDGDMSARAPVEGPDEVAAVAVELNALAARIDELLTQEREAAADLSHRLRTPLTSVRLSVEGLPDSPQREELEAGLDRLERTLTQVIRAARRGVREGVHPRCDAAATTRARVAFWRPLVEDQERRMSIDVPDQPLWVRTTADDLATAIDSLLENVFAHTEEGTGLSVALRPTSYGADLLVVDEGPGIPPGALARGQSDRGSSGLGLDIARGVAEATGGGLELVGVGADGRARGVLLRLHRDTAGAGSATALATGAAPGSHSKV